MPVYKDEKNGRWYAMVRYENWKGQRKQKCKRGFTTKREALEWERTFQQQNAGDLDMTFEAFCELYEKDMRPRLKESTWATKDHITRTKLLPYFGERRLCDIDTKDIIAWQNELLAYRDEKKQPYRMIVNHPECVLYLYKRQTVVILQQVCLVFTITGQFQLDRFSNRCRKDGTIFLKKLFGQHCGRVFDDGVFLQRSIICIVEAEGPHERILCISVPIDSPRCLQQ